MSTTVANFDIAGAADRIVTFANELIASQSARQAEFNVHDRDRATAYLDRLEAYVGVISEPANPLDLPKTHPTAYPVTDFPPDEQINAIENAEVRDLVRRFTLDTPPRRFAAAIASRSASSACGGVSRVQGRLHGAGAEPEQGPGERDLRGGQDAAADADRERPRDHRLRQRVGRPALDTAVPSEARRRLRRPRRNATPAVSRGCRRTPATCRRSRRAPRGDSGAT